MLDATQRTTATSDQFSEFIRRLEDRQEPAAFPVFRQDRNSDGGQREPGSSLGYRSLVIQYQRCVLSSLDSSPYGVLQGRLGAVELGPGRSATPGRRGGRRPRGLPSEQESV